VVICELSPNATFIMSDQSAESVTTTSHVMIDNNFVDNMYKL